MVNTKFLILKEKKRKEKRHERKEPKYSANWLLKKTCFSKNMSEVIQAIKKEGTTSQN